MTCRYYHYSKHVDIGVVCVGNHTVSSSIWNQFVWVSFSKSWNCSSPFSKCNVSFRKTHKCKLIPSRMRKTIWLLISNINMIKFAWRKCRKSIWILFFTSALNFLSTNLFISGSWCASISKALLFPSHHIFHTLNQNKRCTFAGVHIFCTIFCSSSIVSSLARVNLSWFNAAIFSHLRKRFSKFFFHNFHDYLQNQNHVILLCIL